MNPIILYSNGIPISPADLDFGTSVTQAQLNALSSFSQMVNAVPSPGAVWIPTGSVVWTIYNLVLSFAEFAQGGPTPNFTPVQFVTREVSIEDTDQNVTVAEPAPEVREQATSILSNLNESILPTLADAGFNFMGPEMDMADTPMMENAFAAPAFGESQPNPLPAMFLQLKAQMSIDTLTDTLGNAFYSTYLFPQNFYEPQYDDSWKSFSITPGQNTPWAPVVQSGTITGEMITLPLQRAWFSPWVFSSRGWKFSSSSGMTELSDGGSPPQGMMPMYASALIIARNIETLYPEGAAPPPATLPAQPFVLNDLDKHGNAAGSFGYDSTVTDPDSMLIIGFVCTPLSQCPNPDPSLNWGD